MVREFLYRATEPVLMRLRRFLPALGGFDLSPLVVIIVLWFLQAVMGRLLLKLIMVGSV
ncbi:MAG: YggT family protein [Proteobacteria bacterium]|nr:YggT family protein [Pseudomonadota bacterium]